MLKKMLVVAAVAGVALLAIKGTRFFGYMKNEITSARAWLDDQIPVEKEIERLNREVDKLEKDINTTKDALAKELYAHEKLQKEIGLKRARLEADRKEMQARHTQLAEAGDVTHVSIKNEKLSKEHALKRLSADSKLWELENEALASQQESLNVTEHNIALLQQQRAELENQKGTLKVRLQKLAADYKALQVKKVETRYKKDDTRLSKIEKDIEKLEERLGIEQKRVAMDALAPSRAGSQAQSDSLDEIAKRLKAEVK